MEKFSSEYLMDLWVACHYVPYKYYKFGYYLINKKNLFDEGAIITIGILVYTS